MADRSNHLRSDVHIEQSPVAKPRILGPLPKPCVSLEITENVTLYSSNADALAELASLLLDASYALQDEIERLGKAVNEDAPRTDCALDASDIRQVVTP